jgi:hypothetical protein
MRSTMAVRESRPDLRHTTPIWESSQTPTKKLSICPTRSQRYDQSVVMWLQNTMPVRDKYSNRYDRSSGHNVEINIIGLMLSAQKC